MAEPRVIRGIRLAVIREVSKTFVECMYIGDTVEKTFKCPIPHPYAGAGGGILIGPEVNSVVIIATGPSEQKYIIGSVPMRKCYFGEGVKADMPYTATPFPALQEGEITLKSSSSGSSIDLTRSGNIKLKAALGISGANIELSPFCKTTFIRSENVCSFTEAGRTIDGIVKRDKNKQENSFDTNTSDFLKGEDYEVLLRKIGRSPGSEVQLRTNKIGRDVVRNPPLVEKRSIVYEYADSFNVKTLSGEVAAMEKTQPNGSVANIISKHGQRSSRRTDILDLNLFNYNHLIEKVEGTLVDIYGNVLDINRNILKIPNSSTLNTNTNGTTALQDLYRYMRRSVKYHLEINSRKEISGDEPSSSSGFDHLEHSRWSVDVDGEGLTKINIPASSNTGNIPILGRYITSAPESTEDRGSGAFRDTNEVDIKIIPFGKDGPSLDGSNYNQSLFENAGNATAGTAHHEMMSVASVLRNDGWHGTKDIMLSSINNKIGDGDSNAGGRSLHANLDGSAEVSIGADNVDLKSLLLDLKGSIISHYGKDNNGNSIVHQSDGSVIIQIGDATSSGKLEIHVAGIGGKTQKLVVDERGITIDVQGNAVFQSSGDMSLIAGARLLMHGEMNFHHGSCDTAVGGTRAIQGTESLWIRSGIPNTW